MTSHSGPPCNLPAPPLLCHAQDFEAIPQDFDLPTLGPVLRAMRQDVQHGRGFALLRGLPVDRWSRVQVSSTRMAGPAWVLALAESCRGLNLPTQELASSDHGLPDIAGWWQPYSNWLGPDAAPGERSLRLDGQKATVTRAFVRQAHKCTTIPLPTAPSCRIVVPQNEKGHLIGHVKVWCRNRSGPA